jgi:hypothetical protein
MWYKYKIHIVLIQPLYIMAQFYMTLYTIIYQCTLGYRCIKYITIGLQLLMVTIVINGTQVGFLWRFLNKKLFTSKDGENSSCNIIASMTNAYN